MTAAPIPEPSTVYVCGDCAGILLQIDGVKYSPLKEISLGRLCEAHPSDMGTMQATNILEGPPGLLASYVPSSPPPWPAGLAMSPAPEFPPPSPVPAATLGALTEITTRLIVAWTSANKGATCDAITIGFAVDRAREILRATGGI